MYFPKLHPAFLFPKLGKPSPKEIHGVSFRVPPEENQLEIYIKRFVARNWLKQFGGRMSSCKTHRAGFLLQEPQLCSKGLSID